MSETDELACALMAEITSRLENAAEATLPFHTSASNADALRASVAEILALLDAHAALIVKDLTD